MTHRLPLRSLQRKPSFSLLAHTSLATLQSPESELPGKNAVTKILGLIWKFPDGSWSLIMGFPGEQLCWRMNLESDLGSNPDLSRP